MAERENEINLDKLLDSLLASYSNAQPRPGFQTRLLANLRTNSRLQTGISGRAIRLWMWAAATTTAVIAVTVAIQFWRLPALPAEPRIEVRAPDLPANIFVGPHDRTRRPATRQATPPQETLIEASNVRQEVFPTPTALSDQERLLLRYLAGTPRGEVAMQSHTDEPDSPEPLVPQLYQFPGTETHSTR